jgi:PAS domain S-box-containing protein
VTERPGEILAALAEAVIALGTDGRVLYWSRQAEEMFGRRAEELVGRPLPLPIRRLAPRRGLQERRMEVPGADGARLTVVVSAQPLPGPAGDRQGTVLVVKDLRPWLGALSRPRITEGLDLDERLGATVRPTLEATGAEGADDLAARLAEQGARLLPETGCVVGLVPEDPSRPLRWVARPAGAMALAERALGTQRTVEDMLPDGTSVRAVPLMAHRALPDGRTAVGVLCALRGQGRPFGPGERRLIDDFAALANVSLQRAAVWEAAERSMRRLRLAVDLALDLARSLNPSEVVSRLLERAVVACQADRAVLLRVEGGIEGEIRVVGVHDVAGLPGTLGSRGPTRAHEPARQAVETGQPVLDVFPDPSTLSILGAEGIAGVRHTLAVPLVTAGEAVAVLLLDRRREPAFGSEELETLLLFGASAALALRNAYLYERVEEASRVKSDFLDLAAHELRAPLSVIVGYVSLLGDGSFGSARDTWDEPLEILESKVGELHRMVEDLLLAAQLESGRASVLEEAVDLWDAARRAAESVFPAEAEVELELGPEPLTVRGDAWHLDRLLGHLFANAIAYRLDEARPARVRVRVEASAGEAKITVEDRGRGIPRAEAERVFESFTRIDDRDHPSRPGTGLGLYIARQLAERQGGRLVLEWSEPGAGSRFALWLPVTAGQSGGGRPG